MSARERTGRLSPARRRGAGAARVTHRLATAGIAVVALLALAPRSSHAALPTDPAGFPFYTYAQARAAGDYRLACEQLASNALLELFTPRARDVGAARTRCARALRAANADLTAAERAELASTQVVKVRVWPGRARVTTQTAIYGVAPRATGTAAIDDGAWRIRVLPQDAHVGASLVLGIPSAGMSPTLRPGDLILADRSAYRLAAPQVGDIVVFHPPAGAADNTCAKRPPARQACAVAAGRLLRGSRFVKRIVGGPGDRISIRDGRVTRNGRQATEDFVTPCGPGEGCDFPRSFRLRADRYYVLGDNRGGSDDSRFWGPITATSIVGRATRLGPPDAASTRGVGPLAVAFATGAASPRIDLRIRIAARAGTGAPTRTWRLRCDPAGGNWPSVGPACRRLKPEHLATIDFETKDYTQITRQPVRITGRAFGKRVALTFPSKGSGTRRARLKLLRTALGPHAFAEAERRSR